MTAVNEDVVAEPLYPSAGATNDGWKLGFINSAAKATANDTWTVTNALHVLWAVVTVDSNGIIDATTSYTIGSTVGTDANVITLTGASTGAHSALVLYLE